MTDFITPSEAANSGDGAVMAILFMNLLWTSILGSRAGLYTDRLSSKQSTFFNRVLPYTLFGCWLFAFTFESVFLIRIMYDSSQAASSSSNSLSNTAHWGGNLFLACLAFETLVTLLLQLSFVQRLRDLTACVQSLFMDPTWPQQLLQLSVSAVMAIAFCASPRIPKQPLIYALYSTCGATVLLASVCLVKTLLDCKRSEKLDEREHLSRLLTINYHAASLIVIMSTIVNAVSFIQTPSFMQTIVHIVLTKIYITVITLHLYMSCDPEDDDGSTADWEDLSIDDKAIWAKLRAAALA